MSKYRKEYCYYCEPWRGRMESYAKGELQKMLKEHKKHVAPLPKQEECSKTYKDDTGCTCNSSIPNEECIVCNHKQEVTNESLYPNCFICKKNNKPHVHVEKVTNESPVSDNKGHLEGHIGNAEIIKDITGEDKAECVCHCHVDDTKCGCCCGGCRFEVRDCIHCFPNVKDKPIEEWDKDYALFYGDAGVYFVSHKDLNKGIHNPIDVKQFIRQLLASQKRELVEKIEVLFDDFRSSNQKDKYGKRRFGLPRLVTIDLRHLHTDILKLIGGRE